ncbi:hypothetical protein [Embleya sp. NPDC005575]|uniref:hypothetical protein n=1 Tax=Embleya sp. NPDC005575 TaxID=3156892 RepID=UPI0033A8BDE0
MSNERDWFELLLGLMPARPGSGERIERGDVKDDLMNRFPKDFVRFQEVYGGVTIEDWLGVLIPDEINSPEGPWGGVEAATEAARRVWTRDAESHAYSSSVSVVAWGGTSGGDLLCWATEGDIPDAWPIAVWFDDGHWEVYRCGMVEFLCRLLLVDTENPLNVPAYFRNVTRARALHWREEDALRSQDLEPWSML